eukprot:TRINITY_DN5862_c0_g1_i1.p1 TRINITY_DN5862_c0_g1~~TRINITY_DN5862_c0_g1_i1.p1  ORF type:complete len:123 (+),score=38.47 TRINITY_DN5862_c0_g1_i1:75-443(+)
MSQAVTAAFGFTGHPENREWEEANIQQAAHITPEYYAWSKNCHTKGDFTWAEKKDGWAEHRMVQDMERAGNPCTLDEYIDKSCRTHPANKFAAKMTEKRPGEYCDAWTLPRLEACKQAYGFE